MVTHDLNVLEIHVWAVVPVLGNAAQVILIIVKTIIVLLVIITTHAFTDKVS